MPATSRFAPSPTGEPHPGTLLSALLVWLDARHDGAQALLRLEDVDHTRSTPALAQAMIDGLAWLGLTWDAVVLQSKRRGAHDAAIDELARLGVLYACTCSRKARAGGRRAADGSLIYDNRCRESVLSAAQWRSSPAALRVCLPDGVVQVRDEGGADLSQAPARDLGDPVVRSNNGAIAYMLAVVVDDAADGITRIVRGRDIAPSTATQVALQRMLGYPTPTYRHHPLLLAAEGEKLAKLHGSYPLSHLRAAGLTAPQLCGMLAALMGLTSEATSTSPDALVRDFSWQRVAADDVAVRFDPAQARLLPV
ncbi:MAG: hypothetical protein IPL79_19555 [Myxococcales bacterium]|nr:hypothetical protein [Myxococcales bacterium]